MRSYFLTLDDTVNIEGKAVREQKDLITKSKKHTHSPIPTLKKVESVTESNWITERKHSFKIHF